MLTAPAPAPKQPEICASQWLNPETPCPQWQGRPTRLSLPLNLTWSADFAVPEIGARVVVRMNGFGPAVVRAYFHADGYLGLICQPDVLPAWFEKQSPGVTLGHFFGRELQPERQAEPQAPAGDWIPDYPQAAEAA